MTGERSSWTSRAWEEIRVLPVVWIAEACLAAMGTGVAAFAKQMWGFSIWWSGLILAGVLGFSLAAVVMWRGQEAWREDDKRRLQRQQQAEHLREQLRRIEHLLATFPSEASGRSDLTPVWIESAKSAVKDAEWNAGSQGRLPDDVAALILNPRSLPAGSRPQGREGGPTTRDMLRRIEQGLREATEALINPRSQPPLPGTHEGAGGRTL